MAAPERVIANHSNIEKWWGAVEAQDGSLHVILGVQDGWPQALRAAARGRRRARLRGRLVAIRGETVRGACEAAGAPLAGTHNLHARPQERRKAIPLVVRANESGGQWYTAVQVDAERVEIIGEPTQHKRLAVCRARRLAEFWTETRNHRSHGFGFLFLPDNTWPARLLVVQAQNLEEVKTKLLEIMGMAGRVAAEAVTFSIRTINGGEGKSTSPVAQAARAAARHGHARRQGAAMGRKVAAILAQVIQKMAEHRLALADKTWGTQWRPHTAPRSRSIPGLLRWGVDWLMPVTPVPS